MSESTIFKDGKDLGYRDKQDFWYNGPDAFRIADLDKDYPTIYFEADHVSQKVIDAYCKYVPEGFEFIAKRPLKTIVEFGSAGGFFSEKFLKQKFDLTVIEGAKAGYSRTQNRLSNVKGFKSFDIYCQDFRHSFNHCRLSKKDHREVKYDIALCTEVAEHIEPPFHGVLVENLIRHSDMIWFSFEEPNTNTPHLHHPGEFPAAYWIAIFNFHNYGCYMLPDSVYEECEVRGRMIFYNRETYNP